MKVYIVFRKLSVKYPLQTDLCAEEKDSIVHFPKREALGGISLLNNLSYGLNQNQVSNSTLILAEKLSGKVLYCHIFFLSQLKNFKAKGPDLTLTFSGKHVHFF